MSLRLFCLFLALCLTAAVLPAQTPPPAAAPAPVDELVGPIKLPDADIDTVLGLLEIYTGRNILRPQQLPTATYHLVIDKKIPKSEAILALETILSLNQVGVAPLGDKFLKVVALAQTKNEAPEMIMGSTLALPPSGRVATKLFQFEFLRVNEFVPQISPLMTPGIANGIVALDKANAALITDTVSNLQRVETLLQQLDRPSLNGLNPKFYALRNGAKASDIVNKLRAMFQGPLQAQLGAATSYSADDRSNQVIVLADPMQIPLFDELIGKLDVKADPNTRNEIIYLKHASAKDVAPLLSQLVSGQNSAQQKSSGSSGSGPARPNITIQPQPAVVQPADPVAPAPGSNANAAGESTNEFSTLLTILPDERSNAIVVSGTVDDIRLIRDLVNKLDLVLAQVRLEIVLAEVTLSDEHDSGIDQLGLTVAGDRLVGFSGSSSGFGTTVSNGTITAPGHTLAATIGLSTSPRKTNSVVLSVPTITTTHNKKATFFVGASRPTITSNTSTGAATTTVTPGYNTSSVSQQEVGITVTVTPLIGDDGSVQLDLKQETSDVGAAVTLGQDFVQNEINKRSIESFVTCKSGEILVLGGLQKKNNTLSTSRFGPLPFIGDLLGARKRGEVRTELIFFLRPTVLSNTVTDIAPAIKQLDQLPNKDAVRKVLDPNYVTETEKKEAAKKKAK